MMRVREREEEYSEESSEDERQTDEDTTGGTGLEPTSIAATELDRMAKNETRQIQIWRYIVGFTILGAGGIVSLVTFFYLDRQLTNETEDKFYLFAKTIEDKSRLHFQSMVDSISDLSLIITAQANRNNWTFPFVTVEDWELHAGNARRRGFLEGIAYTPVVQGQDTLNQFLLYALEHNDWQEAVKPAKQQNRTSGSTNEGAFVAQVVDGEVVVADGDGPFAPAYQLSPPIRSDLLMLDMYLTLKKLVRAVVSEKVTLMGEMRLNTLFDSVSGDSARLDDQQSKHVNTSGSSVHPHALVIEPVYSATGDSEVGGLLTASFSFDFLLVDLLPEAIRGLVLVIDNTCGDSFTYELDESGAIYVGQGDISDPRYHRLKHEIVFDEVYPNLDRLNASLDFCVYKYTITSSSLYEEDNSSSLPAIYTFLIATIFLLMAIVFFTYDMYVERRNDKMVDTAARSNALVSSIFPATVRERLLAGSADGEGPTPRMSLQLTKTHLKSFLSSDGGYNEDGDELILKSKPIADLFTETTIMFGDICGFTAWSSVREPSQVFTLLETLYRAFDKAASRRGVFKVETVGDCYVAVCGLPDPRKDHAVAMARFARDCLQRMHELSGKLEVILGPDTGELGMRIGLHSGPVTAGVLRGERSRFQLFGDTMNTASRMESTGEVNRIQVSEETAKLLIGAGKEHWVIARADAVTAKGKGVLSTFWLTCDPSESRPESAPEIASSESQFLPVRNETEMKTARLISWNVEVLLGLLKRILKRRAKNEDAWLERQLQFEAEYNTSLTNLAINILGEVEEVIALPFDHCHADGVDSSISTDFKLTHETEDSPETEIPGVVVDELNRFVTCVASMYNDNPFHNFEHASHVTMSVVKLLSRIVAPSEVDYETSAAGSTTLHDHTYGITSDPLTQFTCVFSALIHDVDHPGVSNAQLVKEGSVLASTYKGKSVAEQNSVQLSWDVLMSTGFPNLRGAIYSSVSELKRFRQLIVNTVMATDIVDKELKALRNARWDKAFSSSDPRESSTHVNVNRKATIVIEHLIQASDVAHTMQHWHIYRKWNERFFMECFQAFKEDRAAENPSKTWYEGEIGFFDFYIIPLAKKLKECGVFGVSSDEYLNYATKNRKEWEERGKEIVEAMLEKVEQNNSNKSIAERTKDVVSTSRDVVQLEAMTRTPSFSSSSESTGVPPTYRLPEGVLMNILEGRPGMA